MKKLVCIGIKRRGENGFRMKYADPKQPRPGTYNQFELAQAYPEYYAELIRAGLPAIGTGKRATITIR